MTPLARMLGVRYPILLGPMRGITMAPMAAAVSNSGGFGQLASSGLSVERLAAEIRETRRLTDKPFGVNIPLHRPQAFDFLEIAAQIGIGTITTSGGNPAKIVQRAEALGLSILHKVSTTAMGRKAQEAGVKAVIATGFEAGGHGGKEQITTLCLVPQLVDALVVPVIAAGGIGDGRTLAAAFALGAVGVEIGTRFLASTECPVPNGYKQAVLGAGDDGTTCIGHGSMTIRVLRNPAVEALAARQAARDLSLPATAEDNPGADQDIMSAGMGAGMIRQVAPISDIIQQMVAQAGALAARLGQLFDLKEVRP